MRLYVTGAGGFVGRTAHRLCQSGVERWRGVVLNDDGEVDVLDTAALTEALRRFQPDAILHLAGQSSVAVSLERPQVTAKVNVLGTLALLDAIEHACPQATLLHVGSGDMYGLVPQERLPVREDAPLQPRSPYAASKVAAEAFVLERVRRGKVRAMCVRSFNHTGVGQQPGFFFPDMALRLASLGPGEELAVGNLAITRDFLDVRDVLDAYLVLLDQGAIGEVYNVCSGVEFQLQALVNQMIAFTGIEVNIVQSAQLFRPAEQPRMRGDNGKLCALGWHPQVPMHVTLAEVMQEWMQKASARQSR